MGQMRWERCRRSLVRLALVRLALVRLVGWGALLLGAISPAAAQLVPEGGPPGYGGLGAGSPEDAIAMREALDHLRKGRNDQAIAALKPAVARNPDLVMGRLYLGIAFMNKSYSAQNDVDRLKLWDEAERVFREGFAADQFEARIAYQLGRLLFDRAQMEQNAERRADLLTEAKDIYQRLILMSPRTRDAHYQYALICQALASPRMAAGKDLSDEEKKELRALLTDGIFHMKMTAEMDGAYEPGVVQMAGLHQLRLRVATSEEEAQEDRKAIADWTAKAEELRIRRNNMIRLAPKQN